MSLCKRHTFSALAASIETQYYLTTITASHRNHCAELTRDEGGDGVLYSSLTSLYSTFLAPQDVLHPYFLIWNSSGYGYRSTL